MRRSIPSSSGSSGDRATMPGVGDDSRDTLPEPQPPAMAPSDFNRTIPMGSALTTEWLASQIEKAHQSGVHTLNEPPPPATRSDRVASHVSKHATLANFGSAPPPRLETDDKRWIGSRVDQEPSFSTTQRTFSAPPPAGTGQTLQVSLPAHDALSHTLRAMSVPPPAQGPVSKSISSNPPPPIKPAPIISISPEISIASPRTAEAQPAAAPAQPPPLPRSSTKPASSAPEQRHGAANDIGVSPELKPSSNPPPPAARPKRDPLPGGVSTRSLGIGLAVAVFAILAIVLLTRPASTPAPTVVAHPAATPIAPPLPQADVRPSTEIVTNPPGAEVILRGALVANTPARVTRPAYESLYLVRLRGHQPQLVSLSPHSPDAIRIDLQPLDSAAPAEPAPGSDKALNAAVSP